MATTKPARPPRELDTTVTLRVEKSLVKKLDLIARKVQRSRSNLIRLALEEMVQKQRNT